MIELVAIKHLLSLLYAVIILQAILFVLMFLVMQNLRNVQKGVANLMEIVVLTQVRKMVLCSVETAKKKAEADNNQGKDKKEPAKE
jgi:F0F1-type ATP synthase membrane subunit a